MIFLLTTTLISICVVVLLVSSKTSRYWLLSPAVTMLVYFVAVSFPGLLLFGQDTIVERALVGHILWFVGVLGGIIASVPRKRSAGALMRSKAPNVGNRGVLLFFVLMSIPAIIITYSMLGRVPLAIGIKSLAGFDTDISMHAARQMNTLQHRGGSTVYFGQGYLRQIYAVVSPVFLVALGLLFAYNRVARRIRFVRVMMSILIAASALNGQIWVAAQVFILFVMGEYLRIIIEGRQTATHKILRRGLLSYILLLIFVFGYRYLQVLQGRDVGDFILSTLRRIYSAGAVGLFEIFPDQEHFRYGTTWLNDLRGMLPGSVQSFSYEVHFLIHGGPWGYTMSPGIVASSYVNFGFFGIMIAGFVFTYAFTYIYLRLVRSEKVILVAISLYMSHRFMLAMQGDLSSYIVCLVTSIAIYIAYTVLERVVRKAEFVR